MLYISLAYEHGCQGAIEEALEAVRMGEEKLEKFSDNAPSKSIHEALTHIMFSTKAYLLLQKGDLEKANLVRYPQLFLWIRTKIIVVTRNVKSCQKSLLKTYGLLSIFSHKLMSEEQCSLLQDYQKERKFVK